MCVDQLFCKIGDALVQFGYAGPPTPTFGEEVVCITYRKGCQSVEIRLYDDDFFVLSTFTRDGVSTMGCFETFDEFMNWLNNLN